MQQDKHIWLDVLTGFRFVKILSNVKVTRHNSTTIKVNSRQLSPIYMYFPDTQYVLSELWCGHVIPNFAKESLCFWRPGCRWHLYNRYPLLKSKRKMPTRHKSCIWGKVGMCVNLKIITTGSVYRSTSTHMHTYIQALNSLCVEVVQVNTVHVEWTSPFT